LGWEADVLNLVTLNLFQGDEERSGRNWSFSIVAFVLEPDGRIRLQRPTFSSLLHWSLINRWCRPLAELRLSDMRLPIPDGFQAAIARRSPFCSDPPICPRSIFPRELR